MNAGLRQRLEGLNQEQRRRLVARLGLEPAMDSELVAFVAADDILDEDALRRFMQDRLPDHMVPRWLVGMDRLPRTISGKVDYPALLEKEMAPRAGSDAPLLDDVERRLSGIWAEVLGISQFGRDDDFFDLGGHSLLAMRLFSDIEREFGKALPLATIFSRPTVGRLAEMIRPQLSLGENSSIVTLQPGNGRAPLFCMHCAAGSVFHYRQLGQLLGSDRPVLGLVPSGLDGESPFHYSVEDMAASYAAQIQSAFPAGPYLLCGYSFGGSVAFEVARQLRAAGREVAYTGLFDTGVYSTTLGLVHSFPGYRERLAQLGPAQKMARIAQSAVGHLRTFVRDGTRALLAQMKLIPASALVAMGRPPPVRLQTAYQKKIFVQAQLDYVPKAYDGELTVYRTESGGWYFRDYPDMGWGEFVQPGKLRLIDIPGNHHDVLASPLVEPLAESLQQTLRAY